MFFTHHIYTAILVCSEEENGLMESIFSGYKFVPRAELNQETQQDKSDEEPEIVKAASEGKERKTPFV
jgi:Ni/Fe-hydrogenase 1 B-type cytochrome subunit